MVLSDLLIESLKESVGLVVKIYTIKNFYFEGVVISCDGQFLKFNDRKSGVRIISLNEIREVSL
jgi:hypothetical protein